MSDNDFGNEPAEQNKINIKKILLAAAVLMLIPAITFYAITALYFPHADCKIDVNIWHIGDFWKMMDTIKKYDPSAYSLICTNIDKVSFESYLYNQNAAGEYQESEIKLSKRFWEYYNKEPYAERAYVFLHEVCHSTIDKIRGNLYGLDSCDIEYPCYLRGALLKYKLGAYNKTDDPYSAMLNEYRTCSHSGGGPNDYCSRASIKIKEASKGRIVIENNGTANLHCMMLELSINGVLHPVDCDYIQPSTSVTIYNRYLDGSSSAKLRIFGCDEKIKINI